MTIDELEGQELRTAFLAATDQLEEFRDVVNALNVFPVPDGDTGTNMLLTMRAAIANAWQECPDGQEHTVGAVSLSLAKGAFFGARGNSGVILSQFLKGFAEALSGKKTLTSKDLPLAFKLASDWAYKSVSNPVEGTMLTVIKSVAKVVNFSSLDLVELWRSAYITAQEALEHTPEQLSILRESGVVDSGGLGVVVLIGGVLQSISHNDSAVVDLSQLDRFRVNTSYSNPITAESLNSTIDQRWGFCTQFVISNNQCNPLDLDQIRSHYQDTALSTAVVGDNRNVRVHVHVEEPTAAVAYAESLGSVTDVNIEDMDSQTTQFATGDHSPEPNGLALALLPVAQGKGLAQLFQDSGCAGVIEGGQTMNPSVQQILDSAVSTGAIDVIILPNHSNIILAAKQAAAVKTSIHVVPTESIPQGVAALLAFNPEGSWQENVKSMSSAMSKVVSVEIINASRDVTMNGVTIAEGQYIGFLDGELVAASNSSEMALQSTLGTAGLNADTIVTVYCGADKSVSDATQLTAELEAEYPGIQVDLVFGGQPNHQYLASIE